MSCIGNIRKDSIEVIGKELTKILNDGEFSAESVVNEWAEMGIAKKKHSFKIGPVQAIGIKIIISAMNDKLHISENEPVKPVDNTAIHFKAMKLIDAIVMIKGKVLKAELDMIFGNDTTDMLKHLVEHNDLYKRMDGIYTTTH